MTFIYPVLYTPSAEVPPSGEGDGTGGRREVPSDIVNGSNTVFTFTAPPVIVYRNGVNETRLGTIDGNAFTFTTAPETGDEIEGLLYW